MIGIDGAHGEGGGAIIRTAVALSAVSGKACTITNIRAMRKNPGLQAQHATAVNAVAKLCGADVEGNDIGSTKLRFIPHEIRGGSLSLNVGTAGSTALVLQALMIPAMHAEKPLDIKVMGGTMNRWAPTIGYIEHVTLATLRQFGYDGGIKIVRHGFYPQGGGAVEAVIRPSKIGMIDLLERGALQRIDGSCIASLDLQKQHVAERMQHYARQKLFAECNSVPDIKTEYGASASPGGGIDLFASYDHSVIGGNAIAERGKRAEDVAAEAVAMLISGHRSDAPVDVHLADQLIPYLALAGGRIRAAAVSEHTKTNIWVCEQFLPVRFSVDEQKKEIACAP